MGSLGAYTNAYIIILAEKAVTIINGLRRLFKYLSDNQPPRKLPTTVPAKGDAATKAVFIIANFFIVTK